MFRRFFLAIGLLLLVPLSVSAATLQPEASDLTLTPGTEATATITVANDAVISKNFAVSFVEARFGETAEDISFTALSSILKSNVQATPNSFSLGAGESREVSVRVNLPKTWVGASPVLGVLVADTGSGGEAGNVRASVVSLLFLHMANTLQSSFVVDNFSATPALSAGSPITLSALFHNDGQETVILPNEIRVINMFGKEIDRGVVSTELKQFPSSPNP
jgi:hypothetical protein